MLSAIGAGLTLLSIIAGLIAWWVKRKRAPTKPELIDDLHTEYADTLMEVHKLRQAGNHAGAEAMLARIRTRAAAGWVRIKSASTGVSGDTRGQRLGDYPPQGDKDRSGG